MCSPGRIVSLKSKDRAAQLLRRQEQDRRSRELDRQRREIAAQIDNLQARLEENEILIRQNIEREDQFAADRNALASSRRVTPPPKSTAKIYNKSKPRVVQE